MILAASILLIGCTPAPTGEEIKGTHFELIEIRGMPCIYAKIGHGKMLTCDWSKYSPERN